jgi:hypothetical protein
MIRSPEIVVSETATEIATLLRGVSVLVPDISDAKHYTIHHFVSEQSEEKQGSPSGKFEENHSTGLQSNLL